MNDVVILTPSYNRANTLPKLYESLKGQTDKDFVWMIIDDGSTDNTGILIESFMKDNLVNIKYIFQKNGGKARALNKGFSQCSNAEVIIIVDSDDYLLPTAIKTINEYLTIYGETGNIGGFFFHYQTSNGEVLKPKGKLIKTDQVMTPYQYNRVYGKHDGCICYLNRAIKKYKYPEFKGETYVGPTVMQLEMADTFRIVYSPRFVGVAEYQEGGLTKSGRQLRLKNPMGMFHYSKLMMDPKAGKLTQLKYAVSIWPYALIMKKSIAETIRLGKRPGLLLLTYIPGYILYRYWKLKWIR